MNLRKLKTFWTCLVLFVIGVLITVNTIRYNIPDFTPLAIFALLTGIGFIAAGYRFWEMKKWGAILAVILSCLKLIQIRIRTSFSPHPIENFPVTPMVTFIITPVLIDR